MNAPSPDRRIASDELEELVACLGRVLDCASALDRALDRDFDLDLALDVSHARSLSRARDLAGDLISALDRASVLNRAADSRLDEDILAQARHLATSRDLVRVLGGVRILDRDLLRARHALKDLISFVEATYLLKVAAIELMARTPRHPDTRPTVLRLAALAVRILPPADQARYDEEFRNELHELAAAGAAGCDQFWHAVRLLTRSLSLRSELIEASRSQRAVS